ncbi:hypothetical protein [Olivibacter domesticus]|uniref:Uncharacterized protein n=1 Tax=Olivibacter domesticus TaxID=407022 RepID=A0A1H7K9N3_OLID1|nr:hypothetical protein [Olivibacter domesticus]SEK82687.1 hypothetical protein SAMN05661044_01255 [Olivibacter domesticus]
MIYAKLATRASLTMLIPLFVACKTGKPAIEKPQAFSGIYPHLAMYNNEGECGTGAVVPWGGDLWAVTYGPHLPFGSSDKLYQITPDLKRTVRTESIGGTPANRMIHPESHQLFIGPYAIDSGGKVRVIPYDKMPGRHTGNARHLSDPAGKIYYGTMEEGFYEVDVKTLAPTCLYPDGNVKKEKSKGISEAKLIGAHGKGLYSGQGVLVYSNNGELSKEAMERFDAPSGGLHEWDGKQWKMIRRNQFVEITGPGGITGNKNPQTDPIWTTGWDHKSLLLGVRGNNTWRFFRLPKASHSYDGAHGWNTEWPRIRDIGTKEQPDYLMTMHGMFWKFPMQFNIGNTGGIRPRSTYLKVIGDYTRWNDQLVFGCDDSAEKEFLNKRKAKGNILGPGQSNSNLWFTSINLPDSLGPNTADGAVWQREEVKANTPSDPFLFTGWSSRSAWIKNESKSAVTFRFELDKDGHDAWTAFKIITVAPGASTNYSFTGQEDGEWVRVQTDKPAKVSVHFVYANPDMRTSPAPIFTGLSKQATNEGGLLYALGNNQRTLAVLAQHVENGIAKKTGYYELNEKMELQKKSNDSVEQKINQHMAIYKDAVAMDNASVLVIDDAGRRWRLPFGNESYTELTKKGALRVCREVATERDLFNCHGTFYELPAENADGYAKIRPVSSHNLKINDYASYRGLLVMSGIDIKANETLNNPHIILSQDKQAAVWVGAIDDLWKLGKPTGHGGPWAQTDVKAGKASDPYLIGFYDKKSLKLSHKAASEVNFTVEVDPGGEGNWMTYQKITVKPNETFNYHFPASFQGRWIRFRSNQDCIATAFLTYD